MAHFRDDIRVAIFEKLNDESLNIIERKLRIGEILNEYSKRYKGFTRKEKLCIELTVPIHLPPKANDGHCRSILLDVQKSLNELGGEIEGGSFIYHGKGSWLDKEKKVISENCAVVRSLIPIEKWYDCISTLRRLIEEEIQKKLLQQHVFLRIDGLPYGVEPPNLLGKEITDKFPSFGEFGKRDPLCLDLLDDYVEPPPPSFNFFVAGDLVTGIPFEKYDEAVMKLTIAKMEAADERKKRLELEEKLRSIDVKTGKNNSKSPWQLYREAEESVASGNYELAKGQAKQALNEFELIDNRDGIGSCHGVLANIYFLLDETDEAEKYLLRNLDLSIELGHQNGLASTMSNLGVIKLSQHEYDTAYALFLKARELYSEIRNLQGVSDTLNNLGNVLSKFGDKDTALRFYLESKDLKTQINASPQSIAGTTNNIGDLLRTMRKFNEARETLQDCINYCTVHNLPLTKADAQFNLAMVEINQSNTDCAKKYFQKSSDIYLRLGMKKNVIECQEWLEKLEN